MHPSSTVNLFQFLPFNSAVALPSISLERVYYTFETSNLVVATCDYGSQSIIPRILELQNIALLFSVGLQNLSTLVINFDGHFVLGGVVIPVEAIYTHASRNINISSKVSGLFINFQSVATELVGLNLPGALRQSIFIPTFIISGKVTMEESELIVSATGGNIHAYIIYKETDKSRKAIAFEMSNIEFASILNDVVGLDISGIPYFGTTVLPAIALTFATDNTSDLPDDTFAHSPLLNTLGNIVNKDLTALIDF